MYKGETERRKQRVRDSSRGKGLLVAEIGKVNMRGIPNKRSSISASFLCKFPPLSRKIGRLATARRDKRVRRMRVRTHKLKRSSSSAILLVK